MKKVIALPVALLGALILSGCSLSGGNSNYSTPSTSPAPTSSTSTPSTSMPATTTPTTPATSNAINIQGFAFNPGTLTVKKGTTVTWTNNDSAPHQIKSATFNSGSLSKGQSFSFTFDTVGTFDYSCAIHPSMLGKIVVE